VALVQQDRAVLSCAARQQWPAGHDNRRNTLTSDTLLFDLTDKVAVITLNRPAVRNALNRELSQALMEALQ
jgi:1,4-dihydroxy-2-naphthoyl-CoA synthase